MVSLVDKNKSKARVYAIRQECANTLQLEDKDWSEVQLDDGLLVSAKPENVVIFAINEAGQMRAVWLFF